VSVAKKRQTKPMVVCIERAGLRSAMQLRQLRSMSINIKCAGAWRAREDAPNEGKFSSAARCPWFFTFH
jgi:hypothetical protein